MKYPESETLLGQAADSGTEAEISDFFKGSPWIMLDEIKVQAFAQEDVDIYEMLSSYSKTTEDFKKKGITTLEEALRGMAGLTFKGGVLYWRDFPVTYYIDGVRHEVASGTPSFKINRVSPKEPLFGNDPGKKVRVMPEPNKYPSKGGIPISDIDRVVPFDAIERIDFLRRGEALILANGLDGGALMITTKDGSSSGIKHQFELKDYVPLGYQRYKEYASPLLSSAADAYDLQTASTLLWLPSVRFNGEGKEIELKLPIQPEYDVIIEGISAEGPIYEKK